MHFSSTSWTLIVNRMTGYDDQQDLPVLFLDHGIIFNSPASTWLILSKTWASWGIGELDCLHDCQVLICVKIHLIIENFEFKFGPIDPFNPDVACLQVCYANIFRSPSSWRDTIIPLTLPMSLCFRNGRSLTLKVHSWNKIWPALYFSPKIFLKVTHCSNVCPFFLWYGK